VRCAAAADTSGTTGVNLVIIEIQRRRIGPATAFNFGASVMVLAVGRTDWISIFVFRPKAARKFFVHKYSNQSGKTPRCKQDELFDLLTL